MTVLVTNFRSEWPNRAVRAALVCAAFISLSAGCARPPAPIAGAAPAPASSTLLPGADVRGPESDHHDALGRLRDAAVEVRPDRLRTMEWPLPDGKAWTHVTFWGLKTLAGWRYGDDH